VLAAAHSTAAAGESPRPPADEVITIDVWGLVEARVFQGTFEAIREFERRHEGRIKVNVGTPGGQGDLDPQKLMTAVVAGTPPDVLWFSRHALGLWATRGAFRPIDDLIERDGIDLHAYYEGTRLGGQWEGQSHAMPWNVDVRVLYSNMDVLEAAGYDHPPRTWSELEEMAVALTAYNDRLQRFDRLGFAPNYGNAWLYLYGWLNGAQWLSPDGRTVLLTETPVVDALTWMVQVYDAVGGAEKVQAFQSSAQVEGMGDPFLSGRLAMQISGDFAMDAIARSNPDLNFQVSPPPLPTTSSMPSNGAKRYPTVRPGPGDSPG